MWYTLPHPASASLKVRRSPPGVGGAHAPGPQGCTSEPDQPAGSSVGTPGPWGSHMILPGPTTDSRPHCPLQRLPWCQAAGEARGESGGLRPTLDSRCSMRGWGNMWGTKRPGGSPTGKKWALLAFHFHIQSVVNSTALSGPTTLLFYLMLSARGLVHGKCSVNSKRGALNCRHHAACPLSQRPSVPVQCPGLPCPRCRRPRTFTTLCFLLLHFPGTLLPSPLLCFFGMLSVLCFWGEASRKPAAGRL